NPAFSGKGTLTPEQRDSATIASCVKPDRLMDDMYVIHAIEYKPIKDHNTFAYVEPVPTQDETAEFILPLSEPATRPTEQEAEEFLNSLTTPDATNHGKAIAAFSGSGPSVLLGPNRPYPGSAMFKTREYDLTKVYQHIGDRFACTPFHQEKFNLYSICYGIYGYRIWLAIHADHCGKFEDPIRDIFGKQHIKDELCAEFMRHLCIIVTSDELCRAAIRYAIHVQGPDEFIVTQPGDCHMVVSWSPSVASSLNFQMSDEDYTEKMLGWPVCPECGHWAHGAGGGISFSEAAAASSAQLAAWPAGMEPPMTMTNPPQTKRHGRRRTRYGPLQRIPYRPAGARLAAGRICHQHQLPFSSLLLHPKLQRAAGVHRAAVHGQEHQQGPEEAAAEGGRWPEHQMLPGVHLLPPAGQAGDPRRHAVTSQQLLVLSAGQQHAGQERYLPQVPQQNYDTPQLNPDAKKVMVDNAKRNGVYIDRVLAEKDVVRCFRSGKMWMIVCGDLGDGLLAFVPTEPV
ncbi:hypothetical protein IL306_003215, partial [Fusarium sp. DS 682]